MTLSTNPFAVLGLTPDILRGRSDVQIKALVKAAYRGLSGILHPDVNRVKTATQDFQAIQTAFELLADREKFDDQLQRYLKKKKDQIEDIRKEAEEQIAAQQELRRQAQVILIHWWTMASAAAATGACFVDTKHGQPEFSAFHPPNARLVVHNTLEEDLAEASLGPLVDMKTVNIPDAAFELEIVHGEWTRYPLVNQQFNPDTDALPEGTPSNWVYVKPRARKRSWYWARCGPGTTLPWKVVGGVSASSIRGRTGETSLASLAGEPVERSFLKARGEGYTLREFQRYLVDATPMISCGNYLFGVRYTEEGTLLFHPIGKVQRIHLTDLIKTRKET